VTPSYLTSTSSQLKIVAISIQRAYTKSNIPLMWTSHKVLKSSHTFRDVEQCGIQLLNSTRKCCIHSWAYWEKYQSNHPVLASNLAKTFNTCLIHHSRHFTG